MKSQKISQILSQKSLTTLSKDTNHVLFFIWLVSIVCVGTQTNARFLLERAVCIGIFSHFDFCVRRGLWSRKKPPASRLDDLADCYHFDTHVIYGDVPAIKTQVPPDEKLQLHLCGRQIEASILALH